VYTLCDVLPGCRREDAVTTLVQERDVAKKTGAGKPAAREDVDNDRKGQTSVRLNKPFAKKLAILGKHLGKPVPVLIETWLADKVAEEYEAFKRAL
jgi:hypothetical protein